MTETLSNKKPGAKIPGVKEIDAAKTSRIPIKIVPQPVLRKPEWIRMKAPDSARYQEIKRSAAKKTTCIPMYHRLPIETAETDQGTQG